MMIAAANNPLVAGGASRGVPKVLRVRVLRAFLVKGAPVPVGTVIEFDRPLAAELINANKAVRTDEPLTAEAKAKASPVPTTSKAADPAPKKD